MERPVADRAMEAYAAAHSTRSSAALAAVEASTKVWSDYPEMMIDASEGRFLALIVAMSGSQRILEIGTFTGYSAIAMAEALPQDGHITTLDIDPKHAQKAAEHIASAGQSDKVTIILGPALESLRDLEGPFDLVFIDADKGAYPAYYEAALGLLGPGGIIIADNVLRSGRVLDPDGQRPGDRGMAQFNDTVAEDARVEAVMLTIRDGVTLIRRRD